MCFHQTGRLPYQWWRFSGSFVSWDPWEPSIEPKAWKYGMDAKACLSCHHSGCRGVSKYLYLFSNSTWCSVCLWPSEPSATSWLSPLFSSSCSPALGCSSSRSAHGLQKEIRATGKDLTVQICCFSSIGKVLSLHRWSQVEPRGVQVGFHHFVAILIHNFSPVTCLHFQRHVHPV